MSTAAAKQINMVQAIALALDEAMGRSSDVKELEGMLEKVGVHINAAY